MPDQAFGMALLWLCLSQFPKRFFPELLGLTLAIEVTGVGGYYRTNAQALNYYGFDSYILALHNTIDNVDAGHTRWICEAVHTYMSEIYDQGGPTLQASAWERVWSGVCAWALRVGF